MLKPKSKLNPKIDYFVLKKTPDIIEKTFNIYPLINKYCKFIFKKNSVFTPCLNLQRLKLPTVCSKKKDVPLLPLSS
jgi:hypothetical protein